MSDPRPIHILFVEDTPETVHLVEMVLARSEVAEFRVSSCATGAAALERLATDKNIDVVLMDYHLPDMNGIETARALIERGCAIPIVFLTVHRDMNLVLEVMKLGVREFIVKEDIASHGFPQTIAAVHEKHVLVREYEQLDTRRSRLEAMQEMVVGITAQITAPLGAMKSIVQTLEGKEREQKAARYLGLIRENIERIEGKMEKLKNLREDKTVQYIKDIRMIDLS